MVAGDSRILRVRVSASEKRLIGYVDLPADLSACFSDLLNGPEAYHCDPVESVRRCDTG